MHAPYRCCSCHSRAVREPGRDAVRLRDHRGASRAVAGSATGPASGLRALPAGSLGRAYLAFVQSEGITADGLVSASTIERGGDENAELRWIKDWLRDTHDLWHAVLGYQGDLVGEAALLAFSHHETRNIGVAMIAMVAWLKLGRITDPRVHARRAIFDGRRRAKQTAWFVGMPWHQWLARPVEEVRRELRVDSLVDYQPVRSHEVDMSLVA
ncbi:MAG: hypothetical protein JRF42_16955 [Deltaproteobacteria bacterium]|nr:hypothetical protein [Deltaproteobacteria bacterium]